MLKCSGGFFTLTSPSLSPLASNDNNSICKTVCLPSSFPVFLPTHSHISSCKVLSTRCDARRRVRYDEEDNDDEEYGHNAEITILESYTQSAREEALLVKAMVDQQEIEVLIFKGFSSCLSYKTSPDPSRSVLPQRAVIKCIDRIKGPFDPSNIEYLEKGLTWEGFKSRFLPSK